MSGEWKITLARLGFMVLYNGSLCNSIGSAESV